MQLSLCWVTSSVREKDAIQARFVSLVSAIILTARNLEVCKEDFKKIIRVWFLESYTGVSTFLNDKQKMEW